MRRRLSLLGLLLALAPLAAAGDRTQAVGIGESRTAPYRVLMGQSNSGLFVVWAALTYPSAFSAYIAAGPTLGHQPEYFVELAKEKFEHSQSFPTYLHIVYGDNDIGNVTGHAPRFNLAVDSYAPEDFVYRCDVLSGGGHLPKSSPELGLLFLFENSK